MPMGSLTSSILASARIIYLEHRLDLFEGLQAGLAPHAYARKLFCLGDPFAVIVLIQDEFSHA